MVNKDVLCTIAVTSPFAHRRNVKKRLFEILKQEKQQRKCRPLRLNLPFTVSLPTSPLQKRARLSTRFIHKKDQCVWCMKKEDKKHPNRPPSKPLRTEQSYWWQDFKRQVPFLKNTDIRRRITYLVDSPPDPLAADILYHKSCWKEQVLCNLNTVTG